MAVGDVLMCGGEGVVRSIPDPNVGAMLYNNLPFEKSRHHPAEPKRSRPAPSGRAYVSCCTASVRVSECAYACECLLVCVWAHALASSYLCMCMGALAYVCVCACMCQCVSVFVSVRVCGLTVLPFFFNRSPGIRHPTSCLLNVTYFTVDHVSG